MDNDFKTSEVLEAIKSQSNIIEFIEENKEIYRNIELSDYLNKLLCKKDMKISEIGKKTQFSKSYLYFIFDGVRKPTKEIIIQIAFAMKATLDETNSMLRYAELPTLYSKDQRDSIIIHAIYNGKSIFDTDYTLVDNGYKPIMNYS